MWMRGSPWDPRLPGPVYVSVHQQVHFTENQLRRMVGADCTPEPVVLQARSPQAEGDALGGGVVPSYAHTRSGEPRSTWLVARNAA